MTTLTRLLINPRRRGAAKLLANPQAMHAAVESSLPPDRDESAGRLLWRVDRQGREQRLYIVAPEAPDPSHIVEQAGWETRPHETADYDRFLGRLEARQRWFFGLLANPTRSEATSRGQRGKVKALVSAPQQLDWLEQRSESLGFRFPNGAASDARVVERDVWHFKKNGRTVTIKVARFDGLLEVTDPELLRRALTDGIGRARAYGCGLLTLASPSAAAGQVGSAR